MVLVVEIVSDESADRETKPQKYAKAGIRHFWRIEEDHGAPVVHVLELDEATRTYVPVVIARQKLELSAPFTIEIDVSSLAR